MSLPRAALSARRSEVLARQALGFALDADLTIRDAAALLIDLAERDPTLLRLARARIVNAALEEKRKDKVIGNSLSASVTLGASGPIAGLLERYRDYLPTLFIVSDLTLNLDPSAAADNVRVEVGKARGVKCGRCWRYVPSVRTESDWAGICDRCVEALAEPVNS